MGRELREASPQEGGTFTVELDKDYLVGTTVSVYVSGSKYWGLCVSVLGYLVLGLFQSGKEV